MTHDELLASIIDYGENGPIDYGQIDLSKALRAVLELHKPIQDRKLWCKACRVEDDDWYSIEYPCATIQAIEEELK